MSGRRRTWGIVLIAGAACSAPGSEVAPPTQVVAGTYTGTDSAGALSWTIQQSAPNELVTGTGTFVLSGGGATNAYTLRGTYQNAVLTLRLVGAPGDGDADSVWFSGRSVSELYSGAAFSGSLMGPTASLFGSLSMYLASTP